MLAALDSVGKVDCEGMLLVVCANGKSGVVTDALRTSAFIVVDKRGLGKAPVADNEARKPFAPT